MLKIIGKIGVCLCCAAIVAAAAMFIINDADNNLVREVVIEAGSEIKVEDFFNECPNDAGSLTDVSGIDTNMPSVYRLQVHYGEVFEKDVTLKIEEHTAPTGEALQKMQYANLDWTDASECVDNLFDLNGIAKIEYRDGVPDYKFTGDYMVPVVVTDWYNNSTVIEVPFHVTDDHNAPLFYGIHNITIDDSQGAYINYFDGVTVKDDFDEEPRYTVDSSKVNMGEPGTYEITYSAVDVAGNVRKQNAQVTIKHVEESEAGVSGASSMWDTPVHNEVYKIAMELLETLKGEDDTETALNIFTWVHSNVTYEPVYADQTFEGAVYEALTRHGGDCYGFYACCKMLLDCAGIPNKTVLRYPVTYNGHYWNLVFLDGEWYHCDSTMFMNHQWLYFKQTDRQISDVRHHFNGHMLPARAGGTYDYFQYTNETFGYDPYAEGTYNNQYVDGTYNNDQYETVIDDNDQYTDIDNDDFLYEDDDFYYTYDDFRYLDEPYYDDDDDLIIFE